MIAIIEDDEATRTTLGTALKAAGFGDVVFASRGDEGLAMVRAHVPSLVILDLVLPGLQGLDVCREIRRNDATRAIPIIILTALSDERDMLKGFEMGADDYVTKPFSTAVLIARIRAVLRRVVASERDVVALDGLVVDDSAHTATLNGGALPLTPTEYSILLHLLRRQGRVWTRSQIIEAVHGYESNVTERSVDVQIVGLRRKLGSWAAHIESVRSVGYRMV